ncbi:5-formyltetrahydrofolate cyclo-ligase [hydrothermal vent metagenome]|uniref:5-formyltetrahydrofolate cyclo-ligase n=1 Tax=hydrothermal vent metagenome TaxID=652676 RepID=A0A1W1CJD5_9ZZZZ
MPLTKSKFREKCLKKLTNIKQERKYYRDFLINRALFREIQSKKRKNILFYYPLPNEADIRKTLQKLRKKHTLYLPFMVGKSFKMVPFRLPLKKKRFGIFEAGNTLRDIKKIDIAIVPVVGADGNLQRVGFGKGMYDRFFATLKKRPYTIFIQSELCYTKEKICDSYDVAGDILITPKKKIKRK